MRSLQIWNLKSPAISQKVCRSKTADTNAVQVSLYTDINILIMQSEFASGQQDSVKTDSTTLYKNIESFSSRSKFTRFMYRMVFKPVTAVKKKKAYKKLIQKPYNTFNGKIIRNIDIITLDPFGYSATDTTVAKQNFPIRAGNKIHIKTQSIAIRNLLLFRKNEPFNSLLVKSRSA